MESEDKAKLKHSLEQLKEAIRVYEKTKDNPGIQFLAVSKAFEVAVEYAWRELKFLAEDEGLDAPSPKSAVRQAAKLGFIDQAEKWIDYINARNEGVHDYFSIPEEDYLELAKDFLKECQKILKK